MGRHFEKFGFPLAHNQDVIPPDDTTLFVCSGMQRFKGRFLSPDGGREGTLQSCVRTNDLDLVGDGVHLTFFEMLGNFSFGNDDYEQSVELWHALLRDWAIPVDSVHVHPSRADHRLLWGRRGYRVEDDPECRWGDGRISGECCEVYSRGVEIGNLVNTLGHSTDVGFGWERLHQAAEGCDRVDRTSLFPADTHPVVADHVRCLRALRRSGVTPGAKGRAYVCQRLLRRLLPLLAGGEDFGLADWIEGQKERRALALGRARKLWRNRKHRHHPPEWWYETCGLLPEELILLEGS